MSSAYGDADIVKRAFESTDNNIKNITGALTDASGSWAKMRTAAKEGDIAPDHDVTPELLETVKKIMKARDEGRPLGEILAQKDLISGDTPALVEALLIKDGKVVSRKQLAKNLETYADEALKNGSGPGLFGDQITPEDILRTVGNKEPLPVEEQVAQQSEKPSSKKSTFETGVDESQNKPNMTQQAADTLRQANKRYGDYAETYRKGPAGSVMRSSGFAGQYQVMDSAIAGRVIKPGDTGYQTAKAFLKAGKNSPETVSSMKEMLLNHFRNAVGPDGFLKSKDYNKLTTKYEGAIRAIGERDPGFVRDVTDSAKASHMLDEFTIQRKEAIDMLEKEAASRFMGKKDAHDIEQAVGKLFEGSGASVEKMRSVVSNLTPEGRDGMVRAAVDYLVRAKTNANETLSYARFDKLLKNKRPILEELFTPQQMKVLDAVNRDMQASERSVQLTKDRTNPSGSARSVKSHIEEAAANVADKGIGAIVIASIMEGYKTGGFLGALKMAPLYIATSVGSKIRASNAAAINEIVKQALLDPQFARELMQKLPKQEATQSIRDMPREQAIQYVGHALARSIYRTQPNIIEQRNREKRARGGSMPTHGGDQDAMAPKTKALTAEQVIAGWEKARNAGKKRTKAILHQPDEHVVRALEIANQQL